MEKDLGPLEAEEANDAPHQLFRLSAWDVLYILLDHWKMMFETSVLLCWIWEAPLDVFFFLLVRHEVIGVRPYDTYVFTVKEIFKGSHPVVTVVDQPYL